jgi:hypothetical protein
MKGFQDVVADCSLLDLGFSSLPYTWDNRQEDNHNVKVRLDRAFGDHRFLEAMGEKAVKILSTIFSDHAGLLIGVKESLQSASFRLRGRKSFRYENTRQ